MYPKSLSRPTGIGFLAMALSLNIGGYPAGPSFRPAKNTVTTTSPNGRYSVRFSDKRSDNNDAGDLWGRLTVRDLKTGAERTARVAAGQRGKGVFEGFSPAEQSNAWSPDGLYLAFWDNQCNDEPAVPGGVICHLHEVRFLGMRRWSDCREELELGRYAFAGWVRDQPHTVLEILINEDGQRVPRSPCVVAKD